MGGSNWPGVASLGTRAQSPSDQTFSLSSTQSVGLDPHASFLVDRKPELAHDRRRAHARRPDERVRVDALAVRQRRGVFLHGVEGGLDPDVDAPLLELARRVVAEPRRDLGEDLGRRVDEHPALRDFLQPWVVAERIADEVRELGERLDSCVARADEDEREVALGHLRIDDRVGSLELAQDVVSKADGVREVLEPERRARRGPGSEACGRLRRERRRGARTRARLRPPRSRQRPASSPRQPA